MTELPAGAADAEALVVVLDQFSGPSPSALARAPMLWSDFLRATDRHEFDPAGLVGRVAYRTTVGGLSRTGQPIATTAYRCGTNGFVEVWGMRWDTSG